MKLRGLVLGLIAIFVLAVSCKESSKDKTNKKDTPETEEAQAVSDEGVYEAELHPLNVEVTKTPTKGTVRFEIANGEMKVTMDVQGAPADMQHWQHFHGFVDGKDARAATMEDDANDDGILDVTETGIASGTTMVPFNKVPSALKIGEDSYPKADEHGDYSYEVTVPMDSLKKAFAKEFDGAGLHLDDRVFYIHGIPKDQKLPESVKSLGDIPAQVTLPIAVGKIIKIK